MRTIYLLVHKSGYSMENRKVLRAYANELDAKDTAALVGDLVISGVLEVEAVDFVGPSAKVAPVTYRGSPEPSFMDLTPRSISEPTERVRP